MDELEKNRSDIPEEPADEPAPGSEGYDPGPFEEPRDLIPSEEQPETDIPEPSGDLPDPTVIESSGDLPATGDPAEYSEEPVSEPGPAPEPSEDGGETAPETVGGDDSPEGTSDSSTESPKDVPGGEQTDVYEEMLKSSRGVSGKKRLIVFILVLAVVVIALVCTAAGMYMSHKSQIVDTLTTYLEAARELDFDTMKSLTQSQDFSALEGIDITDPLYTDFIKKQNSKIVFSINRVRFDVKDDTARPTAHIQYPDGRALYQKTINEFVKDVVDTAFTGEDLEKEVTQQKFLALLEKNAEEEPLPMTEADILYPMVKIEDKWKLASLNEETLQVISLGVLSAGDEIEKSLSGAEESTDEPQATVPASGQGFDLTTDTYSIRYLNHELSTDFSGKPCLFLYYEYTNLGEVASSALVDVNIAVYQHGKKCAAAIPAQNKNPTASYVKEVKPGDSLEICQAFSLTDSSNVTIISDDAFSLNNDSVHSLILRF